MTLRAVLFDLGGTLWLHPTPRLDPAIGLQVRRDNYALARPLLTGMEWVPEDDELIEAVSQLVGEEIERFRTGKDRLLQSPTSTLVGRAFSGLGLRLEADVLEAYTEVVFDERGLSAFAPIDAEVRRVVCEIKQRGLKLAVVSNTILTTYGLETLLEARDLGGLFDVLVASSDAGYRKPHARCFEAALKALDVHPGECVFVGDEIEADIYGAQALGMVAVQTIEHAAAEQEPLATPDYVIEHLGELVPIIDKLLAC